MSRSVRLDLPATPNLPDELVIRRAQIEESGALAALCGGAYKAEVWEAEGTKVELFHDSNVMAVLVVAYGEQLLATASLQVNAIAPNSCQIRWVATELEWRRQGLASTLVASLLEIAKKEGFEEVYLRTTADLLGAIALYLQLGFEAVKRNDRERDTWKKVFSLLDNSPDFYI